MEALGNLVSGHDLLPYLYIVSFSVWSYGRREERALWGVFYKDTDLIRGGSTLTTQSPPKGPTSQSISRGELRFQHMDMGGTQTSSP
jgi:hypothetical protein